MFLSIIAKLVVEAVNKNCIKNNFVKCLNLPSTWRFISADSQTPELRLTSPYFSLLDNLYLKLVSIKGRKTGKANLEVQILSMYLCHVLEVGSSAAWTDSIAHMNGYKRQPSNNVFTWISGPSENMCLKSYIPNTSPIHLTRFKL